jgi:hypothetical protein
MAAIAASVNHDGTRTSASVAELKLLASLSKKGGRAAAGRFGGRGGKLDRIRQQEAAMAEAATSKAAAATAAPGSSQQSDTTSEVLLSAGSSKKRKAAAAASGEGREPSVASGKNDQEGGKKRKKNAKALAAADADAGGGDESAAPAAEQVPKKPRIVIEAKCVASAPSQPFVPTPATGACCLRKAVASMLVSTSQLCPGSQTCSLPCAGQAHHAVCACSALNALQAGGEPSALRLLAAWRGWTRQQQRRSGGA